MVVFVQELQNRICIALEGLEHSARFKRSAWERPGGGGGDTRVISGGKVFEKGGVNTSVVHGKLNERMLKKLNSTTDKFFATGISLVVHPRSPKLPTVHANFRYFEQKDRAWFGGGADLTPYVPVEDDARHFHECFARACSTYSEDAYARFKKECDDYFYLPHREEHRGIGGIFFDYLTEEPEKTFDFVKSAGNAFLEAYLPIVEKHKDEDFTEREKKFQLLRRGRYVEFNLIYDRGTLFGLETKGNPESILMSLPPEVHFEYKPSFEETEDERKLMSWFRKPINWLES